MPKTTNSFIEEKMKEFKGYFPFLVDINDKQKVNQIIKYFRTALLESEKRVREETVRDCMKILEKEVETRQVWVCKELLKRYASSKGIDLTK